MKGLFVAVLATTCAIGANARMVVLSLEATMHTDQWCLEHGGGSDPSRCVKHPGCCFDGGFGQCHSCDVHSDEWCKQWGGAELKKCLGFAGCTFDSGASECVSNSDPDSIDEEITCEEALATAAAAETPADYVPQCNGKGEWLSEQEEPKSGMKWCVDENGHEIPDTRATIAGFKTALTNCAKERKRHDGEQCPNAVTLITKAGEVMMGDDKNVGNCDITCNTDQDCKGDQWCCYNGCGYQCRLPIQPKADCNLLVVDASMKASDAMTGEDMDSDAPKHGTEVTISCAEGHTGTDPVTILCKHGNWDEYKMECFKSCGEYQVPDNGRMRDYELKGKLTTHGSKIKVKCVPGYGAVEGSNQVMLAEKDSVECINGAWTAQTLVCSACFDQGSSGPHGWWLGIHDSPPTKRAESKDCKFFASRPLMCNDPENKEALDNCRISCRTCEESLMEYKVKAVRKKLTGEENYPAKWLVAKTRSLKAFENWITELRRTKVAKRVKKDAWVAGQNKAK